MSFAGEECPVDVVFVLDGSGSVAPAKWSLMISFLNQLVGRMDIDNGNTRVGAVSYSTRVNSSFELDNYTTVSGVQSGISALTHRRGETHTHLALKFVRENLLISEAGDRSDVPNVVVVLTDGGSRYPMDTQVCTLWNIDEITSHINFGKYLKLMIIM